ncbi:hypothetical protein RRG08_054893 [Elysia crispata]|uniref:Uncharacterized protein n=1 Tax=Elysia crispata TaxID=231223 RepID=A0AAE1A582_9GAST|nr:hypothetical protein RRG08_054893 [Elysia crispata]
MSPAVWYITWLSQEPCLSVHNLAFTGALLFGALLFDIYYGYHRSAAARYITWLSQDTCCLIHNLAVAGDLLFGSKSNCYRNPGCSSVHNLAATEAFFLVDFDSLFFKQNVDLDPIFIRRCVDLIISLIGRTVVARLVTCWCLQNNDCSCDRERVFFTEAATCLWLKPPSAEADAHAPAEQHAWHVHRAGSQGRRLTRADNRGLRSLSKLGSGDGEDLTCTDLLESMEPVSATVECPPQLPHDEGLPTGD